MSKEYFNAAAVIILTALHAVGQLFLTLHHFLEMDHMFCIIFIVTPDVRYMPKLKCPKFAHEM